MPGSTNTFIYRGVTRSIATWPFHWRFRPDSRSSRVRAHTTPQCYHHGATLILGLAAPLVRCGPRGSQRMQLSYCFHGATATHQCSNPITSHSCFDTRDGGLALGCVPGLCQPPLLTVGVTSGRHPIHLHAGIRLSCLILAHYSCRPRSPVSSKARGAIPDFTAHPFIVHRHLRRWFLG